MRITILIGGADERFSPLLPLILLLRVHDVTVVSYGSRQESLLKEQAVNLDFRLDCASNLITSISEHAKEGDFCICLHDLLECNLVAARLAQSAGAKVILGSWEEIDTTTKGLFGVDDAVNLQELAAQEIANKINHPSLLMAHELAPGWSCVVSANESFESLYNFHEGLYKLNILPSHALEESKALTRLVMVGGARVAKALTAKIKAEKWVIIEEEVQRCLYLANSLPDAEILHGSFLNQEIMEQAGLAEASHLIIFVDDKALALTTLWLAQEANPKLEILIILDQEDTHLPARVEGQAISLNKKFGAEIASLLTLFNIVGQTPLMESGLWVSAAQIIEEGSQKVIALIRGNEVLKCPADAMVGDIAIVVTTGLGLV